MGRALIGPVDGSTVTTLEHMMTTTHEPRGLSHRAPPTISPRDSSPQYGDAPATPYERERRRASLARKRHQQALKWQNSPYAACPIACVESCGFGFAHNGMAYGTFARPPAEARYLEHLQPPRETIAPMPTSRRRKPPQWQPAPAVTSVTPDPSEQMSLELASEMASLDRFLHQWGDPYAMISPKELQQVAMRLGFGNAASHILDDLDPTSFRISIGELIARVRLAEPPHLAESPEPTRNHSGNSNIEAGESAPTADANGATPRSAAFSRPASRPHSAWTPAWRSASPRVLDPSAARLLGATAHGRAPVGPTSAAGASSRSSRSAASARATPERRAPMLTPEQRTIRRRIIDEERMSRMLLNYDSRYLPLPPPQPKPSPPPYASPYANAFERSPPAKAGGRPTPRRMAHAPEAAIAMEVSPWGEV